MTRLIVMRSTAFQHCGGDSLGRTGNLHYRAFTLVELVVVVLILAIFAAVAVPTFTDSLLFHRVESAARRFKADIDLTRHTARLTSTSQTLTVLNDTYSTTPAVVNLDRPNQVYTVDLGEPPYELIILAADFGGRTDVTFDGFGKPSSGGTIILMTSPDHRCTLTLDATTGEVTIARNHSRARSPVPN
jgi:prepilin-type N-terminal cleavage/methylation domain-containing protein